MTRHLSTPEQILNAISAEVVHHSSREKRVMVAFDLDSTLLETSTRMTQIMRDFAAIDDMRKTFPKECAILEQYVHHPDDWGIEHSLERAGLLNSSYEFFHELMKWWRKKFFSNEYLHLDQPLEGAAEFVDALVKQRAHVCYLTAREEKKMWDGTIKSLKQHGFFLSKKNRNLFLKKDTTLKDSLYKKAVMENLLKDYGSLWFFENEPVNLNLTAKDLPQVKLVLIDSVHSGRELPPTEIASIKSFRLK